MVRHWQDLFVCKRSRGAKTWVLKNQTKRSWNKVF